MAAGKYNFTIEQGTTFSRTFTWKDNSNNPINLTGYTAKLEIKDFKGNLLETLTSGSGITLGGSSGTIAVSIAAVVTTTFTFDSARYDLKMTDASGNVTRLLEGVVVLDPEVTQ